MSGTARRHCVITPSDTINNPQMHGNYPVALRFGVGGTAIIVTPDDVTLTYVNVQNGETIPISVKRVNATGSSGIGNIVGYFE